MQDSLGIQFLGTYCLDSSPTYRFLFTYYLLDSSSTQCQAIQP